MQQLDITSSSHNSAFYHAKESIDNSTATPELRCYNIIHNSGISLSIYGINYPYSINVMNTLNKASHLSCKILIVFLHNNYYLLLNLNIKVSW